MNKLKIAVIGKSAAGKSAFIRSFSSMPECINSVGKGQTTRSYAEYLFLHDYKGDFPQVEADIITLPLFCEKRIAYVLDRIRYLKTSEECRDIDWMKQQFDKAVHTKRIKEILLYSAAFFDIREFQFLDSDIVEWSEGEFNDLKKAISVEPDTETDNGKERQEEKDGREMGLEDALNRFYRSLYERIINSLKKAYENSTIFTIENNICRFSFPIGNTEAQSLFTKLLKVDEKTRESLTGIISKVRIISGINEKYAEKLKSLKIDCISLIDTYGLDHSDNIDDEMLVERYNRIFNTDYPEISVVFFVEALHAGASNDFKKAITILYQVRPEIMTYVIGTYIDENEKEILNKTEWLFSEDKKVYESPCLNGKVQQIIDNDTDLLATLLDQGITESMAQKRCEIMQKRFAPFCGDLRNITKEIDYEKANIVSIGALFSSIVEKEHLGDGYIPIHVVLEGISQAGIVSAFSRKFIENVIGRFAFVYGMSASRTRWKIRENLENYILGFNGSTLDATWKRVFKDAFNMTFTKNIRVNGQLQMLSDALHLEGNSKIAFDEIIATMAPFLLKRECEGEEWLDICVCQIDCGKCVRNRTKKDNCIWNAFITAASFEAFGESYRYNRVIDWLNELHQFDQGSGLEEEVTKQLQCVMQEKLIYLCRTHNLRLAGKSIRNSDKPYIESKEEAFKNYKEKYDVDISREEFDGKVNMFLAGEKR